MTEKAVVMGGSKKFLCVKHITWLWFVCCISIFIFLSSFELRGPHVFVRACSTARHIPNFSHPSYTNLGDVRVQAVVLEGRGGPTPRAGRPCNISWGLSFNSCPFGLGFTLHHLHVICLPPYALMSISLERYCLPGASDVGVDCFHFLFFSPLLCPSPWFLSRKTRERTCKCFHHPLQLSSYTCPYVIGQACFVLRCMPLHVPHLVFFCAHCTAMWLTKCWQTSGNSNKVFGLIQQFSFVCLQVTRAWRARWGTFELRWGVLAIIGSTA